MVSIRRPFLLIEVLIALALVALTLFPLIAVPVFLVRSELQFNESVDARRIIQNSLAEIALKLYKNEIEFNELFQNNIHPLSFEEGFERYFIFRKPKVKEKDAPRYILIPVEIHAKKTKDHQATFQLFIEKRSHEG